MEQAFESSAEKKLFGRYTIVAHFLGANEKLLERTLRRFEPEAERVTIEELERSAIGEASALGLHNLGMDQYVGNKPRGWKPSVTFSILKEDGSEFYSFETKFDGFYYKKIEDK